jgi:hypothetical protein
VPGAARRDCSRRTVQTPIPLALTPLVASSWSRRLEKPTLPVTGFSRESRPASRSKPYVVSCAREPFTSSPGSGAVKPRTLRACSREARRRETRLSPAPGPRAASCALPRRRSAVSRTQGAFHRGTFSRVGGAPRGVTRACFRLDREIGRLSTGCAQPVERTPAPLPPSHPRRPDGTVGSQSSATGGGSLLESTLLRPVSAAPPTTSAFRSIRGSFSSS